MTDDEMLEVFMSPDKNTRMFDTEFEKAVEERVSEIESCSDQRLGQMIKLAIAIDCYYGPQSSFLGQCAEEAANRLSYMKAYENEKGW